jgi:hypothetical protein
VCSFLGLLLSLRTTLVLIFLPGHPLLYLYSFSFFPPLQYIYYYSCLAVIAFYTNSSYSCLSVLVWIRFVSYSMH